MEKEMIVWEVEWLMYASERLRERVMEVIKQESVKK